MESCDNYPPKAMLIEFPNWMVDHSGKSQYVADGMHIKLQRHSDSVSKQTDFTAGEAYLPSQEIRCALLRVGIESALTIIVYEEEGVWGVYREEMLGWLLVSGSCGPQNFNDPRYFPLRYITALPTSWSGRPIRGIITPTRMHEPWVMQE